MCRGGYLFLLLPILLLGCSLDYRTGQGTQKKSEEIPDTVLYNFTTTSVRNQQPYFRIKAEEAQTFNKKNITVLKNLSFQEFDSDGKVVVRGTAEHAVYHTDTQNAELSGTIEVYSAQEEAKITTGYLFWNDKEKTLTGKSDLPVTIVKDDGSEIRATGFEADVKTRTVRFSSNVRGTFVEKTGK